MVAVLFFFIDNLAKHCSGRSGMVLLSQIGDILLLLCANIVLEIKCCLVVLCIGVSSDWINFSNTISWVVVIYAGFTGEVLFCSGY